MPKNKSLTWLSYMDNLFSQDYNTIELNVPGIENFFYFINNFNSFFRNCIPMIYLVDYSTGKYLMVSESVKSTVGYKPLDFVDNGVAFTLENLHKNDLRLYNEEIFSERLNILKKIPPEEHPNYLFSYNYWFKNSNKEYLNFLQRNCIIKSDSNGNPLLSLGMVINITNFRNEGPVIQVVDKLNRNNNLPVETIYKKAFYYNNEDRLFTKREREVLLWTADGLTSKDIANKLFVSESTIINHRKNMQQKAYTKNISELVSFSIRNGIRRFNSPMQLFYLS